MIALWTRPRRPPMQDVGGGDKLRTICRYHAQAAALPVIASQRLRADARPDDRLREAIQSHEQDSAWLSLRS